MYKVEYFAKSKKKTFSHEEQEKIIASINELKQELEDVLEDWELSILEEEIQKLRSQKSEHQITVSEHEDDIVKCCEKFLEQYGRYFTEKEKILVLEACRRHDWGKVNLLFQRKVNPGLKKQLADQFTGEQEIPHGFLSGMSISEREFLNLSSLLEEKDFEAFITALYYHHTRDDILDQNKIEDYCRKFYTKQMQEYLGNAAWEPYTRNAAKLLFRNHPTVLNYIKKKDRWKWNQYLVIKGLLNKFDYTVSAGYDSAEEDLDLEERELVKNILAKFREKRLELRQVQAYMQNHADENLIVIAPTGSGKTEAALLWLNGEKGFYTLPLKVSSNAIYERIKEEYDYKNVSLLHSDSMQRYLQEYAGTDVAGYEQYERAKILSRPLTVCTVDQLLKFVYKAPGTEMLAATLKYSKLIIDEIQAYSPRVIAAIIYGLKTIQELGGRFAIMTATFPPVLKHFMRRYGLREGVQYQFRDFSEAMEKPRHKVAIQESDFDMDEIIAQGRKKKVLVICNTVSKAQELSVEIEKKLASTYLLHSRYLRKDREILEKKIMEFSHDREEKGVWITTQIVEASLDIDFDLLYTEMCTADSLLQRMGRCNRKWRYIPVEANVIVYVNWNGVGKKSVYSEFLYRRSLEKLGQYEGQALTEKMKTDYINQVYATEEIKQSSYYSEIEDFLKHFDVVGPWDYSKEEADTEFRNIHSITIVPDAVYRENQIVFQKGLELCQTPHVGKSIRNLISAKLNALTLNINLYGKFPEGIDRSTIGENGNKKFCDIHRACLVYEFDPVTAKGRGLLLNTVEDESCFI